MKTKVYCGRPFSGFSVGEIEDYYRGIENYFKDTNIKPIFPIDVFNLNSDLIITKTIEEPTEYLNNKTIATQDIYLLDRSNVVYINFKDSNSVSIGAVCELAIAYEKRKHTIVCIDKDNIHNHCFVETMSNYISDEHEKCLEYILRLN